MKKNSILQYAFLLFVISSSLSVFPVLTVNAQDLALKKTIELDSYLEEVRVKFPLIVAAERDRDRAAGENISALGEFDIKWKSKASFIPEGYYETNRFDSIVEKPTSLWGMNLFSGYRQGNGNFAVYDGKDETTPAGEVRAGMQLPLLRDREIDDRRAGLAITEVEMKTVEFGIQNKKIEVIQKASKSYWVWVSFGKRLGIAKDLLVTAKERDYGIRERVSQGDLPEFELKDNQRTVLQRETQLIKAERSYQQASIELSVFISDEEGLSVMPKEIQLPKKMLPPGPMPVHSRVELEEIALKDRPEAKLLQFQKEQVLIENKLANNQTNPKLDFLFEVSKGIGQGQDNKEPTNLESGVLLEIPIQVRKAEGKIISTQAKMNKLDSQIEFFKQRIKADVQDALSALTNAREQIDIVRKELKFARELEQGERDRFAAGESTILIVNLREQATADAAIKEIDSLAEYHIAEANLKAALGEF